MAALRHAREFAIASGRNEHCESRQQPLRMGRFLSWGSIMGNNRIRAARTWGGGGCERGDKGKSSSHVTTNQPTTRSHITPLTYRNCKPFSGWLPKWLHLWHRRLTWSTHRGSRCPITPPFSILPIYNRNNRPVCLYLRLRERNLNSRLFIRPQIVHRLCVSPLVSAIAIIAAVIVVRCCRSCHFCALGLESLGILHFACAFTRSILFKYNLCLEIPERSICRIDRIRFVCIQCRNMHVGKSNGSQ
jgi:hypothetical protein